MEIKDAAVQAAMLAYRIGHHNALNDFYHNPWIDGDCSLEQWHGSTERLMAHAYSKGFREVLERQEATNMLRELTNEHP